MNLLKNQADISSQRAMPVENVDDSSKVITESSETVQLYYYNSGVLTSDAGQAAGVLVIGKLAYSPVLDDVGSKVANKDNKSLSFTCLALTTEKPFRNEALEQSLDTTGTILLQNICKDFSNGDYTVDYRTGTIYAKKATTASTMTSVGYKRPSSTVQLDAVDIQIGAVELKDGATDARATVNAANTARTSATTVLAVQPIDETGAIIKGGGASVTAQYISPTDFTAAYTSPSTLTLTGLPYTLTSGVQIVYVKVRNTSTNVTTTYVAGSNNYGFGYSAGVVTIYLNGVAATVLASTDMYEVGLNGQTKTYDPTTDTEKSTEQSPLSAKYVADSIIDTTNVAAATNYYPSSTGMSMDGYKNMSITGKIIEGDAVTDTIEIQATNDEDTTGASWITVYFYDVKNNIMNNIITTGGVAGTYTFAIDLSDFNFSYFRVKGVTADATNTWEIKMRRTAL